jgi:hypothetical protein
MKNNKLFIFCLILIGSIDYFSTIPAFAQPTHCSNYWVNPNTGKTECFGGNILNNSRSTDSNQISLERAFAEKKSNIQVRGEGTVIKLLPDDLDGGRHQKFIIKLASGQTLLIAHNIDIAPKISLLREGDLVSFYGEYEWNERGGVIHWTHRDPNGVHIEGWLKHGDKVYQ